jgi:predicted MPP superfamily phosphohydrolase
VGDLGVPYVFIRGNHDSAITTAVLALEQNVTVLDYSGTTVDGVAVVGAPDPRFTPDKSTGDDDFPVEELARTGERLADVADDLDPLPVIAMVHDPRQAPALDGVAPVVLAGHTHNREVSELDGGTLLMVQGSTGGAGLRGLQGEYPEPLTCTVLYVDRTDGTLRAYDDITLGGLGLTEATIQRTLVDPPDQEGAEPGTPGGDDEGATGSPAPATASPTG